MQHQQIKFNIQQDGTLTEEVIGVTGAECLDLTKRVEDKLGSVLWRQTSTDYYQPVATEENVSLQQGQN